MNAVLWTGNGSTQNITGVGFQPDFVWAKKRSGAESHGLYDAVRGASNRLVSNTTAAAVTDAGVSAFLSDGFSISGADSGVTNDNGSTYVGWNWKANGAGVTNTAGSITSTVSANTTSGFSIVTWTANGSSPQTIGHGLGVAPRMIITKQRNGADNWFTYHASLGATQNVRIDETAAAQTQTGAWNNTAPTSTVFSTGNFAAFTTNGNTQVAYCFAPISGFSAFGSYTANNSTDGVFVYLGFRPRFLMIKRSSSSGNSWGMFDTTRSTYNATANNVWANQSYAENSTVIPNIIPIDILSNGFKLRTDSSEVNGTGTYIYAAFAESPFKNALAR
jgi:hypothetical protein